MKVINDLRQSGKTKTVLADIMKLIKNDALVNKQEKHIDICLVSRTKVESKILVNSFLDVITRNFNEVTVDKSKTTDSDLLVVDVYGVKYEIQLHEKTFTETTLADLNMYDYVLVENLKTSASIKKETIFFTNVIE